MITIVADDKIPFLKGPLEPFAFVRYLDDLDINALTVKHADALLIRTRTVCNESLLHGSQVKFIATATIGFDHIDTAYCEANAIHWVNAPGCNAGSVQQYIASVLSNLVIRHGFSLADKTLGIIGVGHVGKKVEALGRLLGMKVLLNDPPRARTEGVNGFVPLEELLQESDIVTLHVPLTRVGEDKTFHLIDKASLDMFKSGSWLINSSRGEIVDGSQLWSVLRDQKLNGAVLDVWENEPFVDQKLLKIVTLATPHIAGYSIDGKRNGTVKVVRDLGVHFNLPVTSWEPSGIPTATEPLIFLDCRHQPPEKLLCQAILHTYDVAEDDLRLRSNPGEFEKQRGSYPVRREFPAYKIMLSDGNARIKILFEGLGFSVIEKNGYTGQPL